MMTPFLTCSHKNHKSGASSYETLLSNVMKKCLPPTSQIWLGMQLTQKRSSIVQFAIYDYGGETDMPHWSPTSQSHEVQSHVTLFILHFIFCFVKVSKWWGVTRSAQPHVHMYMFCPDVISTLYGYLKTTNENFQKILFSMQFFSQLNT
jgi:hypothetical protein